MTIKLNLTYGQANNVSTALREYSFNVFNQTYSKELWELANFVDGEIGKAMYGMPKKLTFRQKLAKWISGD